MVIDDSDVRNMKSELDNLKKKIVDLEARQSNTELDKMKKKLAKLGRLGVEYVECPICDQGFINQTRQRAHIKRNHQTP